MQFVCHINSSYEIDGDSTTHDTNFRFNRYRCGDFWNHFVVVVVSVVGKLTIIRRNVLIATLYVTREIHIFIAYATVADTLVFQITVYTFVFQFANAFLNFVGFCSLTSRWNTSLHLAG